VSNHQITFVDLEGSEQSLDADYFRPDKENVHVNDEKRMAEGFYRLAHYLRLVAAPGAAFDPFVGMTHRKLKDDLGYNACRGTQRVTNALYKREHVDPTTGTTTILCVLTGRVIRGYLAEAREERGKTGVGLPVRDHGCLCDLCECCCPGPGRLPSPASPPASLLPLTPQQHTQPPRDAEEEAAEEGGDKKILPVRFRPRTVCFRPASRWLTLWPRHHPNTSQRPMLTAMKQAAGKPTEVLDAARRVGDLLYELHESRETALWVEV
jgi:hypothetical protein